jgi:hypothetical protein
MRSLISHLRRLGHNVIDLSDVPSFQERDIDLVVDGQNVEVKSDFYKSENVFLEVTCNRRPGCVFKSRADYWLYYYPLTGKCYRLPLAKLQWFLSLHMNDYEEKLVGESYREDTGRTWYASGRAVPIADLIEAGVASVVDLG